MRGLLLAVGISAWLLAGTAKAQCACDVTVGLTQPTIDGVAMGVEPGQSICLESGTSTGGLRVVNLRGTAGHPITIRACDQRTISGPGASAVGIDLVGVEHVRLTGFGRPLIIDGFNRGVFVRGGSTDVEIDWVTFRNTSFVAIDVRTDPLCDGGFSRAAFTMKGLHIHHNTISDVGDAMYIGELACLTGVNACAGVPGAAPLLPHFIEGVDVHDNLMERSARTTLKIACSPNARVHHNVVRDYGVANAAGGENNGLETRAGMTGQVFSNVVERGTGHAVFMKSASNTWVHNNVIIDPQGFGVGATEALGRVGWRIEHNTIIRPQSWAVRSFSAIDAGFVLNTLVVAPVEDAGAVSLPSGWRASATLTLATLDEAGFIDPDAGDYGLALGAPAIDIGVDAAVSVDFRGARRDRRPDIGAFEFGAVPPDVGPGGPGAEQPSEPEPEMPKPTDEEPPPSGCGCSSVGALPWAVVAAVLLRRRRGFLRAQCGDDLDSRNDGLR